MSGQYSCMSMDDVKQVKQCCVDIFTEHPHKAGESYCQHLAYAGFTGFKLVGLGLISIVNGVCPFLFTSTVSEHVPSLSKELLARRCKVNRRGPRPPSNPPPSLHSAFHSTSPHPVTPHSAFSPVSPRLVDPVAQQIHSSPRTPIRRIASVACDMCNTE
jgi:hypothetical protein